MNEDYLLKIGEVITFCNGRIYYDFIAIYSVLEMALFFYVIMNDVIMCSSIIHFPVIYFLT